LKVKVSNCQTSVKRDLKSNSRFYLIAAYDCSGLGTKKAMLRCGSSSSRVAPMSRLNQPIQEKRYLYVTQEVAFCAAHKLYRPELTLEQNVALFGKCANPNGHGHNFTLQATFKGEMDLTTGMVIDFAKAKQLLKEIVVIPLDHKNLNEDIPFLQGLIPTSENVVVVLWDRIQKASQQEPWRLMKLKLASSLYHWVEYFGPEYI